MTRARRNGRVRFLLGPLAALMSVLVALGGSTLPVGAAPATPAGTAGTTGTLAASTATANTFPTGITFDGTLTIGRGIDVTSVALLYRAGDDPGWNLQEAAGTVSNATPGPLDVKVDVDLQSAGIPPGIPIVYAWQVIAANGTTLRSSPETVEWFDNRETWTELASAAIRLHSFQLDPAFARQILASAQSTIDVLATPYGVPHSRTIDIWVYPDQASFRGSLPANTRDTVAGGSFVGYSLIVAVIPNGSTSEIDRVIPHEISHQMLYQATRNPYTVLPVWFDEGMATHIQVGGTSTYLGMVVNASHQGALFDLMSLTAAFPYSASQATLAYAASWSAVLYIEETYGTAGIERLIASFATGAPVDAVMQQALGRTMDAFNHDWKAWIASLPASA